METERGERTRAGVLILDAKPASDRRLVVHRRVERAALSIAKHAHSTHGTEILGDFSVFTATYPSVWGGAVEHGVSAPERRPRERFLRYAQEVALGGQILLDGARRLRGRRALVVTELARGALAQRRRNQLAQGGRGRHVVVVAEQLVRQALVVIAVRHEAEVQLGRAVVLDGTTCFFLFSSSERPVIQKKSLCELL